MDDINSIVMFDSSAKPDPEPVKAEATGESTAPPAESKQERDEGGKFKAKETKAEEAKVEKTESKEEPKAEKGQMSALLAERAKRQSLQSELEKTQARLRELEEKKGEKPDFFENPEKAIEAKVAEALKPHRERLFKSSIKAAAAAHDDFEEAAESFAKLLEADPSLQARWLNDEDPGEFIYTMGTSTPEHRQKLTEKWKGELSTKDAEIAALKARVQELEGSRKQIEEVPESLNRQPSGATPYRKDDDSDINKIVRFQN